MTTVGYIFLPPSWGCGQTSAIIAFNMGIYPQTLNLLKVLKFQKFSKLLCYEKPNQEKNRKQTNDFVKCYICSCNQNMRKSLCNIQMLPIYYVLIMLEVQQSRSVSCRLNSNTMTQVHVCFFLQYNLSLFHIIICFSVTILQINNLSREIPYKNKTFIKYDNLYLHSVI